MQLAFGGNSDLMPAFGSACVFSVINPLYFSRNSASASALFGYPTSQPHLHPRQLLRRRILYIKILSKHRVSSLRLSPASKTAPDAPPHLDSEKANDLRREVQVFRVGRYARVVPVAYLRERGVRCIGVDSGSVQRGREKGTGVDSLALRGSSYYFYWW